MDEANIKIDNPAEEKEIAIDIFKNSVTDFLEVESEEVKDIVDDYNGVLMLLMTEDQQFKKSLENALLSNQEKLTEKEFIVEGKKHAPTIANWLKDFIRQNGSGLVDNLVLSQFLTKTENAKKLEVAEKKLLYKLLILYRNLRFFPQSLEKLPEDEWEIFPLESQEKSLKKTQKTRSWEEERVAELQSLLEQYAPGSLERKAIEEELNNQ